MKKKTQQSKPGQIISELEKELGRKNRELEIEAALEKVRSQSLAMHKSKDLEIVITVLLQQLEEVGILLDTASIVIPSKDKKTSVDWTASKKYKYSKGFIVPFIENGKPALSGEINRDIVAALKSQKEFTKSYSKKEKDKYYQNLFDKSGFSETPEARKEFLLSLPGISVSTAGSKNSYIQIFSYSGEELSAADLAVLKRFAMVFEQCYIRFQDLEKAEAQARESQIEAALERVRSLALGMRKSEEVGSVTDSFFNEFNKLSLDIIGCSIVVIDEDKDTMELWRARSNVAVKPFESSSFNKSMNILKKYLPQFFARFYIALEERKNHLIEEMSSDIRIQFINTIAEQYNYSEEEKSKLFEATPEKITAHFLFFKLGYLALIAEEKLPDENLAIARRFIEAFAFAYTRFLDIKKAEAQAREAQIEAALERVRAGTMAMHNSSELADAAGVLFHQLVVLGIIPKRCFIGIIDKDKKSEDIYLTSSEGKVIPGTDSVPMMDQKYLREVYNAWKNKKGHLSYKLQGQQRVDWTTYIMNKAKLSLPEYTPDKLNLKHLQNEPAVFNYFFFSSGYIGLHTLDDLSETEIDMLKRFAAVFQQTYTRFLDLQKAEEQAREAQIEAALERVRSRSMGMHKSNELRDVVRLLYKEFRILVTDIHSVNIQLNLDSSKDIHFWASVGEDIYPELYHLPYSDLPIFEKFYNAFNSPGEGFFEHLLNKEEKDAFFSELFKIQPVPPKRKKMIQIAEGMVMMGWFHKHSGIDIVRYNLERFNEEEKDIVKRFAAAFEQTYIRFLDLQKAEAQAREANIVAALERVRSLALGMRKSEEVGKVTDSFFAEFKKLTVKIIGCSMIVADEKNDSMEIWRARSGLAVKPFSKSSLSWIMSVVKKNSPEWYSEFRKTLGSKKGYMQTELSGEERLRFLNNNSEQSGFTPRERERYIKTMPPRFITSFLFFKLGYLALTSEKELPEENLSIARRFVEVFDFAYTRFLDLQKAEAQAREAEIELALERVRARTMAMHKTDELQEVVRVVAEELKNTGVILDTWGAVICTYFQDSKDVLHWTATDDPAHPSIPYLLPYFKDKLFDEAWASKNRGDDYFAKVFSYDVKNAFFNYAFEHSDYRQLPDDYKKIILESKNHGLAWAWSNNSAIMIPSTQGDLPSEEEKLILIRFAKVFEQAYIRFLDLQKAEAQARESEIQLALERVRARTMAMHKSDELAETAAILFQQMTELGVTPERINICLIKEEDNILEVWATDQQGIKINHHFNASLDEPTTGKRVYDAWKEKKKSIIIDLSGKELNDWIRYVREVMGMAIKDELVKEHRIHSVAFFSQGMILTTTPEPLPKESIKLLERFADVFNLTYRRFLDLQKAEAQAQEAIKQASLDRVRGEIASMRTTEDLNRITPIIWRELKTLEVPFIRCGVFIIDEDNAVTHVYLTTPEGKSLGVLNLSFDANELTTNTVEYWKKKQVYKEHWNKEEFITWTKSMMELGQVQNAETYQGSSTPPESLNLHFVPFAQGMLYVGDIYPLTEEKLDLVKTLAEAFSIAYARYEDFKNIEEAKNKIEITLNELKAAQAQLVQSEKMASLGELTAGIAHEIKNPLNFVNNFSDISRELLEEIKTELENNNKEEILAILEDLKLNLEKINQHGKRADSIVKGMLLHSRGTSGEKTLTDINDLLEQYVNLAYHGMRAQDKEFNITIEKDYDKTLKR